MSIFISVTGLAQPCLSDWNYRQEVLIDNAAGGTLTNYQVLITLNTQNLILNSKMKSNGGDLRILSEAGTTLPFWIENGTIGTTTTRIWVKVNSITAGSTISIYAFYGNSSVTSIEDPENTFDLFDDFKDVAVNPAIWNKCSGGTYTVSGGSLRMESTALSTEKANITSIATFPNPVIIEGYIKDVAEGLSFMGQINASSQGYAAVFDDAFGFKTLRMMKFNTDVDCIILEDLSSIQTAPAAITTGIWKFAWPATSNQQINWPGGNFSRIDNSYSLSGNYSVVLGNLDQVGAIEFDWVRVRQYTSVEPIVSLASEAASISSATASNNGPLCENSDLQLTAQAISGAVYNWSGPNGFVSSLQNPSITGVNTLNAGTYSVQVSIPSGCSSVTIDTEVEVSPTTVAGTLIGATTVCRGSNSGNVTITGNTGDVVRWESSFTGGAPWSSINSTVLSLPYVNLINSTYYQVVIKSGVCGEEISNIVEIKVDPVTDPGMLSGSDEVCIDGNSGSITLSGNVGDVIRWESSTNNGTTWLNITNNTLSQTYTNLIQTTLYRAVVRQGVCSQENTIPAAIDVRPLPEPDFSFNNVCFGNAVQFINQSSIASGNIASYKWDFGDGNNGFSVNPQYIYQNAGTYDVTLTAISLVGCDDVITKQVIIHSLPVVEFSTPNICDGQLMNFTNLSTIANGTITSYSWDFGDGTNASDIEPIHQYFNAGTFLVKLTAISDQNCISTFTSNVTVNELPLANFSVSDECINSEVSIINKSTYPRGSLTYAWDMGNGITSTSTTPAPVYSSPGTFSIKLVATSNVGCKDSINRTVNIIDAEVSVVAGADQQVSQGFGVTISASGAVEYSWSPAQGLIEPNVANPFATPMETTTYTVTGTDALGCMGSDELTITVIEDFKLIANNVFTPNGDGINDTWVVDNILTYGETNVFVYDKWGAEVFSKKGYENDWEGVRGKDLLPDGSYFYIITFDNSSMVYKGALTILRNK